LARRTNGPKRPIAATISSPDAASMPTVLGSSSSLTACARSMSSGFRSFGTLARFGFSPSTGASSSTYGP
jgi:hypothetical protein